MTSASPSTPPRPADSTPPIPADVTGLTYEQARDELVSIVARLESGKVPLEESMNLWERGEALAAHCSRWLDGAQARLASGTDGLTGSSSDDAAAHRPGQGEPADDPDAAG